jgi:sugar phosphate permease
MGQKDLVDERITAAAPRSDLGVPTRVRYQVLGVACSLAILTYIQRLGFMAGAPEIKSALGLSDTNVGDLMAIWALAYGLFEVPGGLLGDRWGGRAVLTGLVLAWSFATAGLTLVVLLPDSLPLRLGYLLVLRFLFGMFQAGGFPGLARVLTDWMPVAQRGSAQGLVWMSSRLGGAVSPLLLAALFGLFGGEWRWPFLILAAFGVVWCAAFWPWFRNKPWEKAGVNTAELQLIAANRPPYGSGHVRAPWAKMVRSRSVWALCLMYGFTGYSGYIFTSMMTTYLQDTRGLRAADAKWVSSLPLACGILTCALGGVFSDWIIRRWGSRKWGRRVPGLIGHTIAGVAILSTIWVPSGPGEPVWPLALLFAATFACSDLAIGPAWASCGDIGERYAGTLAGTMNMIGAFFGATSNVVTGRLLDAKLPALLFVSFACSYWLAALCWFGVDATKPLPADPGG